MLSIARALMGNPRLLLMDEPMEGLAPVIVEKLFEVLEQLRDTGDFGIILVEQYVSLALNFAPRTIVLDRGRIVYDGGSAELAGKSGQDGGVFWRVRARPGSLRHPVGEHKSARGYCGRLYQRADGYGVQPSIASNPFASPGPRDEGSGPPCDVPIGKFELYDIIPLR